MTENTEVDQQSDAGAPIDDDQPHGLNSKTGNETSDAQVVQNEPPDHGDREAAKYRRRLRDTEAERDRLAEQLVTARKAVVEAELDRLPVRVHKDLIWMHAKPSDFFEDESGELNRKRLDLIVDRLKQLGAAQVRGWNSGEGRGNPKPHTSAKDRAAKLIMGRTDQ